MGTISKNSPYKVALFLDNKGNRRHHLQLLALEKAGLNPKVIVFKDFPKNQYLLQKGHKDKILFLKKERREAFKKLSWSLIWELTELIKKENIKVILTQRWKLVKYLFFCKFLCKNLRIIYYIVIGGRFTSLKRRLFFRLLERKIDLVCVNSRALKEELLKYKLIPPEKIKLLYSAVDPQEFEIPYSKREIRKFLNWSEKEFLFGMVAQFRKEKDQAGLIKTFYEFLKKGGKAKLVLVGDGNNLGKCKGLADKLNLKDKIIFMGKREPTEIPIILKALDVFVYSTFTEGMPMAVLEAMASQLPLIATDAQGLPDIFDTPLNFGILVPKGDYEALTSAMLKLYTLSEEERKEMGKQAKQRLLEAFSPLALSENTLSIFKLLLTKD